MPSVLKSANAYLIEREESTPVDTGQTKGWQKTSEPRDAMQSEGMVARLGGHRIA